MQRRDSLNTPFNTASRKAFGTKGKYRLIMPLILLSALLKCALGCCYGGK